MEIYAVDEAGGRVISPLLHICNPGRREEMSAIYQNPDRAHKRWLEFDAKLRAHIDSTLGREDSTTSPIMEAIQAVSLRTFRQPGNDGITKRLTIVSDLIQNVPGKMNQYQHLPAFASFKSGPYYAEVKADLSDVTVSVLYLIQPRTSVKWPDHYRFWEQYLSDLGGMLTEVEPIHGAG